MGSVRGEIIYLGTGGRLWGRGGVWRGGLLCRRGVKGENLDVWGRAGTDSEETERWGGGGVGSGEARARGGSGGGGGSRKPRLCKKWGWARVRVYGRLMGRGVEGGLRRACEQSSRGNDGRHQRDNGGG